MVGNVKTASTDLFVRRCVACGYDGSRLHGADLCPACGCDLRERPARSYAEMEGLIGHPIVLHAPLASERPERWRPGFGRRWLSFLFLVLLGFIVMLYLVTAALP